MSSSLVDAIRKQNDIINASQEDLSAQTDVYIRKAQYVNDSILIVRRYAGILFWVYWIVIVGIVVSVGMQYARGMAAGRNKWIDGAVLVGFVLFPFTIYTVEHYLYAGVQYLLSFVYNRVYVSDFDRIVTGSDLYSVGNAIPNYNGSVSLT